MDDTYSRDGALPLPGWLPPPLPPASSRRSRQRFSALNTVTIIANNLTFALNAMYTSNAPRPEHASHTQLGPFPHLSYFGQVRQHIIGLTTNQRNAASAILQSAWNFLRRVNCDEGVRGTECVAPLFSQDTPTHGSQPPPQSQAQQQSNAPFSMSHDNNVSTTDFGHENDFAYVDNRPRCAIIANKVALPQDGASVNIIEHLPPPMAAVYSHPRNILADKQPEKHRTGVAYARKEEYLALTRSLLAGQFAELTTEPIAVNGVHAVEKPDGSQRLIIDARAANECFEKPYSVELPNGGDVANLVHYAQHGRPLFAAKVDLDNFFHRFRMPAAYLPYFALPPVRAGDIGAGHIYGDDTMVYPCLNRLPMGWSHSVLLAQRAHEYSIYSAGLLKEADAVLRGHDVRLDRLRHLIYVDDLILIGTDRDEIAQLQQRYIEFMRSRGLPAKMSKVVLPTADGLDVLGLEFNGRNFIYGARASKLLRLVHSTHAMLRNGFATGIEMASLVGKWTWVALVRRPVLAVLSAVYRFQRVADKRKFQIWPSVAHELRVLSSLAPLLIADLAMPFFDHAVASDASAVGLGVVAGQLIGNEAVDSASVAGVRYTDSVQYPDPAISVPLDVKWHTVVSVAWRRRPQHINVGELMAASTAVRWVATHSRSHGSRIVLFNDSTAVVGALSKGRTSSFAMQAKLRPLWAVCLLFQLRVYAVWTPSLLNPADWPSRHIRHESRFAVH